MSDEATSRITEEAADSPVVKETISKPAVPNSTTSPWFAAFVIAVIAAILLLLYAIWAFQEHNKMQAFIDNRIEYFDEERSIYYEKNTELDTKLVHKEAELHRLKERIARREPTVEFIAEFIKARQRKLSSLVAAEIAKNVLLQSQEQNIPASVIVGMMDEESDFRPMVVSTKGAIGLMQIMFKYHGDKVEQEKDLFEIDINVRVGTQILKGLVEKHGLEKGIAKYRGGASQSYLQGILLTAVRFEMKLALGKEEEETASAHEGEVFVPVKDIDGSWSFVPEDVLERGGEE